MDGHQTLCFGAGAELKLRPIDDCLESQLNQAFTATSYLKLQDLDYTAGLAMRIAEAVSSGKQQHRSGRWLGSALTSARPTSKWR